jgi:alcohol dehydrogenase
LTDKGVKKAGLVDKIIKLLEKEKLEFEAYTNITGEPTIPSVRKASEFVREGKYDLVIGLGGGTCMDTSKIVSYLATNIGDISDYARFPEEPPSKKFVQKPLPHITIATTAGTGAEFGGGGVIIKPGIIKGGAGGQIPPDVVIVDPAMTLTCPPRQTAATGMDGLNHMIQYALGKTSLPLTDALIFKGITLYYNNLRTAFFNGKDIRARWKISLAAMLWGWIPRFLAGTRYGMTANVSEMIGPIYGIPHGVACAVALPYTMGFALPASIDRLALVDEAFGEDILGRPLREVAFRSIELVAKLVKDLELPTSLKELNVPREDIPKLVDCIMTKFKRGATGRRPLTKENVTELFNRMWEGKLDSS